MASCLKKFSTLIIYCQATSWSMSSVLPSLICMASRRKHAQPGSLLQSANMCDFLLQREQDTMLPLILSHPMFLREIGSRQTQKRAALSFGFGLAGPVGRWLFSFQCISDKTFLQIRINFLVGNHPSQTFLTNQDAFPRWKSSLTDFSSKSGCISSLEIIPPRHFQQIRMHFHTWNHPSRKFSADQDAFLR